MKRIEIKVSCIQKKQKNCVSLLYIVMINTKTKTNLWRKGFISVYFPQSSLGGSQGRNLEVGAEAYRERNAACWLSLDDFLSLVSYTTQDHLSRDDITHSGLGPPISVNNQ